MPQLNSPMEILKLLDKSNCRDCKEATCLAFAATVFRRDKRLQQCTHLEAHIIEQYDDESSKQADCEREEDTALEVLKKRLPPSTWKRQPKESEAGIPTAHWRSGSWVRISIWISNVTCLPRFT